MRVVGALDGCGAGRTRDWGNRGALPARARRKDARPFLEARTEGVPRMKWRAALALWIGMAAWGLGGCADVHVEIGCDKTAPPLTGARPVVIEKSPVCGVHRR